MATAVQVLTTEEWSWRREAVEKSATEVVEAAWVEMLRLVREWLWQRVLEEHHDAPATGQVGV